MTPTATKVCKPILDNLNDKVRQGVKQRVEAMIRELEFLREREDQGLTRLRAAGWRDDHLHVIFLLNSFYQRVLGPEKSAARKGPKGLGHTVPIKHGRNIFDTNSSLQVNAAEKSFIEINKALSINLNWLYANTCSDLVYAMTGVTSKNPDEKSSLE